jgi:hypothetical protein
VEDGKALAAMQASISAVSEVFMPHSLARWFIVAILASIACNVAANAFAQASPYPLTRAQPYRVIPAGTLLEIDRGLSIEPVKDGVAKVHLQPNRESQVPANGKGPVIIRPTEAFEVIGESETSLFGRFPRAVMLRVNTKGIRIIARDEVIARMTILHFEPSIEKAMMGGPSLLPRIEERNTPLPRGLFDLPQIKQREPGESKKK